MTPRFQFGLGDDDDVIGRVHVAWSAVDHDQPLPCRCADTDDDFVTCSGTEAKVLQ